MNEKYLQKAFQLQNVLYNVCIPSRNEADVYNNDRDNLIILNTCKSEREWCDTSAVLPEVVAPLLTSLR
jgi:hypothetical protein